MKTFLTFVFLLVIASFPQITFAQQEILSAGFDAVGDSGSVSGSIGQVAFSAWTDTTGNVIEGVQQPYEIFNIPGFSEIGSDPVCLVYPNPTTGIVTIKFSADVNNTSCSIYDVNGILLRTRSCDSKEVSILMDDLQPATYFLVILKQDQPTKTYKIIKR
jgi:hypothetical protein